ncbi:homocysteine S-methyltransferase [Ligilactobacillus pobuzihii]|uniref:S-methylmethionine:homocysteine methyltransferase n=1 Tax=Ligilactobacillus pobuzihii TaxID=449659 RepID=A0A0R2LCY8_9LACO|nr:homocysteine S-methyltransferase [Ligilactobacillus pobuzihii]KRK08918.1 homocysteine methyltransferase [Ligilactobacillus pobuzihii E100301 = KCTC 13174]KRN99807.1 homocysteine methyltransferase [Ligilactobacillus pobuzihii]GEN49224.1 homocysteine S-methyltransferase [Ligilactobacillus pobuzihii]
MNLINDNLKEKSGLVLDGAMATELEKYGVDTSNDLWSATALINNPDAVKKVHQSYFHSGADIAITNTYQANVKQFEKEGFQPDESKQLILDAAQLAIDARNDYFGTLTASKRAQRAKYPVVAGSIGPYGAYLADGSEYTGAYKLSAEEYQKFHYQRMSLLAKAGVDLFAFETQPNFEETKALASLLNNNFSNYSAWITFSIKDANHLCDGTSLAEAIAYFESNPQIVAIGINCVAMATVLDALKVISANTSKPIIIYPNNGDTYDPKTKKWVTNEHAATFAELTPQWLAAGAKIIGGCCRTTPKDIKQIADSMTHPAS